MRISDWSSDVCSCDLLPAHRLAGLYQLPQRWADMAYEQCRRARGPRYCPRQESLALCRLGPRRLARGYDVQLHRNLPAERRRSVTLVDRCPRTDRGSVPEPAARAASLDLESPARSRDDRNGRLTWPISAPSIRSDRPP